MKNKAYNIFTLMVLTFGLLLSSCGKDINLKEIKSEIIEISEKEINAFKTGDCETFDHFIDDNATFYLNGRKAPNKDLIVGFCKKIQRPFEKPSLIEMDYIPISTNSAYVVRTMEFSKDEKIYKKEIVTKIWVKENSEWKIMHLHSTIKEL